MKKLSLPTIGFLQATGIVAYILAVGWFMTNFENFDNGPMSLFGPLLGLTLFVTSALITASMALGYPIILFWEEKKVKEALKLVLFTAGWLALYFFVFVILLSIQ